MDREGDSAYVLVGREGMHTDARTCKLELPDRELDLGFSKDKARLEVDIQKKREQDGG